MRENEHRIFTLAWAFPPMTSGESVVCRRSLEYSRCEYDVCSGTIPDKIPIPKIANVRIYPEMGRYFTWSFRALRLFRRLDRENNYKIVLSRVMPAAGHFAGLLIKLIKPRIKWVVYFSDPIWNSPFISFKSVFKNDDSHRPNYLLMKIFGIPSRIAVNMGNLLVFNNERLARYVLGVKYEKLKDKVVIAPYGHEGILPQVIRGKREKFVMAHVGQIYGNRTLDVLIKAVSLLKESNPKLYSKLEIQQIGFICDAEREKILNSTVKDCFRLIDTVEYNESIRLMRLADCLLIIDPVFKNPECNIYVPAKIFDYMSTGLPILAIADNDSATADIVDKVKGILVSQSFIEVYKIIEQLLLKGITKPDLMAYETFHCNEANRKFDDAIWALLDLL